MELTLVEEEESSDDVEEGRVIRCEPASGERVEQGSTLLAFVSTGPGDVAVPRLRGQTEQQARDTLASFDLAVGSIEREPDPSVPDGSVIRSNPAEGVDVAAGSQVDLVISTGPTPSPTPSPTPVPTPTPTPAPTPTPDAHPDPDSDAVVRGPVRAARPVLAWPAVVESTRGGTFAEMATVAPITVDESTFESEVLNAEKPVLVDFWAAWCGPCRLVSPVVESIGDKHAERISVAKVNTDENQQLAMRYSIFSIPTLILFENGREAARLVGYMPQEVMEERLSQFLA